MSESRAVLPEGTPPWMSELPVIGEEDDDPEDDAGTVPPDEDDDVETPPADGGEEPDPCEEDPLSCLEIPADCSGQSYGAHIYLFCTTGSYWGAARSSCQALGLDLVIIESAEENAFIASHVSGGSWIGASDRETEGSFRWVIPGGAEAGAEVSFTKWATLSPDNCGGIFGQQDCARISANGNWDDSACDGGCLEDKFAYVCESY